MAYDRLFTKITKENLWLYVLRLLRDRPMYAYKISKEIKASFGFTTALVTVYVIIYKMEREGLIQVVKKEKSTLGRPDRKYYDATDLGSETLQRGIKLLEATIKKLGTTTG